MLWLGKTAKSLFIFLFILFSFGLTTQGRSVGKCHMSQSYPGCHNVTTHDGSYDECGKIVYRPYSSCISIINFIWLYLHQFFDNSMVLMATESP